MFDFTDKVVLVSGGSRGIGKAIVMSFVKAGATVCFMNRSADTAQKLVEEIKPLSDRYFSFLGDISSTEDCENFSKEVIARYKKIDVLVNNAGVTKDGLFLAMKPDSWDQVIKTNLTGTFNLCKSVVRPMIKAKGGRIINIGSVVGYTGNPGQANYSASKAALVGFTKSLAKELASRNITCNIVAPGFIETDMTEVLTEDQKKATIEAVPMKKMGTVQNIADGVLFLASPFADYVTGTTLHINGGMF